jgi:short-subunit dehydrogenase/acyl carrier protein
VSVVACDVADRVAVAGLLEGLRAQGPPLSAVVHAAGVAQDTPLADMDLAEVAAVLDAKVAGARHLDALLGDTPLEAFVLFSSVAGVWGGAGQGAYAAANASLDALARKRRTRGLAATSIAWGLWAEGGMGAGEAGVVMQRRGLQPMAPALAVAALRQAVEHDETVLTVAGIDWHRFATAFTSARPSPLIGDLPEVARTLAAAEEEEASVGQAAQGRWAHRLAGLPTPEQHRLLLDLVCGEAAAVLGHRRPDAVETGRAFRDLGFDSLTAVELRNRLRAATGLPLPATLVFDYPTAVVLADRIRVEIVPDGEATAEPVFTDLDRLETSISGAVADDATRAGIAARLRAMLSRLDDRGVAGTVTAVDSLKSATSEEVFDFVNNELGIF